MCSGATVLNTTLLHDAAAAGPLNAGGNLPRSFAFSWPAGVLGAGLFEFIVSTDSGTAIFESNALDTGESNNSARITATSAPDLA
jgi:hypothetical protein